jgi:hypothetical protein
MKFLPVTTKNIVIFLASGAIASSVGLWSSSMIMERTIGKATANGKPIFVEGRPVVTTVDRPNKNKLMLLFLAAGLVGAVALATTAVDGNGDRILCPETLPDDIMDTSKVLGNNLSVAALFLTGKGLKWAFGKSSMPRQILLSALPVKNRDFLKESISQKDWFKDRLATAKQCC